jgi:hypothetical protein
MKLYLASSWRNEAQPALVKTLRAIGHEVYDFRNPAEGDSGFHWSEIDPEYKNWDGDTYRKALLNSVAQAGFNLDFNAMGWADACVLLLPCGRSAHLEAGWFVGMGKPIFILLGGTLVPELMYKFTQEICIDSDELFRALRVWEENHSETWKRKAP